MKPARDTKPELQDARITQHAIGLRLRRMFEPLVDEPAPEEFLEILRRADRRWGDRGP